MTLKECYEALGGDYDEALGRLRSERLVQKFVLKFLEDGSYDLLLSSVGQSLLASSERLTEALRDGKPAQAGEEELIAQVKEDYRRTVQAIQSFQEGIGE